MSTRSPSLATTRICFVAPYIWPVLADDKSVEMVGGAEVQQSIIGRGLRDSGLKVTFATHAPGHPLEFEFDGFRIVNINRDGKEFPVIRNIHPRLTCIWQAMARAEADIYFQRCASAITLAGATYGNWHKKPFIYSGASDPDFRRDELWKKFPGKGGTRDAMMFQWGLRRADAVVAQHSGQVEDCLRSYGKKAVEIPNCYAAPSGANFNPRGKILWVSSIKPLKRPELFLEIAKRLPHLDFCIVGGAGTGREPPIFTEIKRSAALLPNLEFVGFVPYSQVDAYFDNARLFINTSEFEGFPNTFLQSWARGIPTISFFDCGARENGESVGIVCNDLDGMVAEISRLTSNVTSYEMASERALGYFERHHSVPVAVNKYRNLFETLLAKQGGQ